MGVVMHIFAKKSFHATAARDVECTALGPRKLLSICIIYRRQRVAQLALWQLQNPSYAWAPWAHSWIRHYIYSAAVTWYKSIYHTYSEYMHPVYPPLLFIRLGVTTVQRIYGQRKSPPQAAPLGLVRGFTAIIPRTIIIINNIHNYGEGKLESLHDTGGHTHSQTQFHIVCTYILVV